jgi:hypothetical protein
LSERARGRIAWIGKGVVAPFRHAPIQGLEIVEAHIHFAPHDKMIREAGLRVQLQRQGTDRAKIDGHILSGRSVTSGRSTGKDPMVVHQFD